MPVGVAFDLILILPLTAPLHVAAPLRQSTYHTPPGPLGPLPLARRQSPSPPSQTQTQPCPSPRRRPAPRLSIRSTRLNTSRATSPALHKLCDARSPDPGTHLLGHTYWAILTTTAPHLALVLLCRPRHSQQEQSSRACARGRRRIARPWPGCQTQRLNVKVIGDGAVVWRLRNLCRVGSLQGQACGCRLVPFVHPKVDALSTEGDRLQVGVHEPA
jgi:hypothetical protein